MVYYFIRCLAMSLTTNDQKIKMNLNVFFFGGGGGVGGSNFKVLKLHLTLMVEFLCKEPEILDKRNVL